MLHRSRDCDPTASGHWQKPTVGSDSAEVAVALSTGRGKLSGLCKHRLPHARLRHPISPIAFLDHLEAYRHLGRLSGCCVGAAEQQSR